MLRLALYCLIGIVVSVCLLVIVGFYRLAWTGTIPPEITLAFTAISGSLSLGILLGSYLTGRQSADLSGWDWNCDLSPPTVEELRSRRLTEIALVTVTVGPITASSLVLFVRALQIAW